MIIPARIPSIEFTQTAICAALFASATALVVGCAEQAKAEERAGAPYTWTGFYAGGQVGYTFGTSRWTASSPGAADVSGSLSFTQPLDPFSETGSFFAGLQGGYNYMLANRVVIGGEVDATFPTFPDRAGISMLRSVPRRPARRGIYEFHLVTQQERRQRCRRDLRSGNAAVDAFRTYKIRTAAIRPGNRNRVQGNRK
jgi:hypothetical protein